MKVEELMTRNVKTCQPGDALTEAARIMWNHDCGCVPVVDDDGRLVGLITDRDMAMAAYLQGKALHAAYVTTAMSKEVRSCRPDESVAAAVKLMSRHQVRRLPVIDSASRVVGLLALSDVAREGSPRRGKIPLEEVGAALVAISEPLGSLARRRASVALPAPVKSAGTAKAKPRAKPARSTKRTPSSPASASATRKAAARTPRRSSGR